MSTKHITTDRRFAASNAANHLSIPLPTIEATMMGRPQRQAIILLAWAEETCSAPARALLGWAARHPAPAHEEIAPCPREDREKSMAARIPSTPALRGEYRPVEDIAARLGRISA